MGLAYEWGESSWIVANGEASREPRALITRSDCPGKELSMSLLWLTCISAKAIWGLFMKSHRPGDGDEIS